MARSTFLAAFALALAPDAVAQVAGPFEHQGFCTDRPAYEPGDTITIYQNWDQVPVRYALRRVGSDPTAPETSGWPLLNQSIATTGIIPAEPAVYPNYGSFVEFTKPCRQTAPLSTKTLSTPAPISPYARIVE